MRVINLKSLIMGIGIGMIVSAFLSIAVLSAYFSAADVKNDEVIESTDGSFIDFNKSSIFGSPNPTPEISTPTPEPSSTPEPTSTPVPAYSPSPTPNITPEPTSGSEPTSTPVPVKLVELAIKRGDTSYTISRKLKELNLVDNFNYFDYLLGLYGLQEKIIYGNFNIPDNATEKEIIKIITGYTITD